MAATALAPAPTEKKTPATKRIVEIDGVRGLAICMVVLWHYVHDTTHPPEGTAAFYTLALTRGFWIGLDMFFVMSGFLQFGGILVDIKGSPKYLRTFYSRRVFRTLPLYSVWLLLFAVGMVCAPRTAL